MEEIRPGFKRVWVDNGRYYSLYSEKVEYSVGSTLTDAALPDHQGGLYACGTADEAWNHAIPSESAGFNQRYALVLCACAGPFIEYGSKFACSQLYVIAVIEPIFQCLPYLAKACKTDGSSSEYRTMGGTLIHYPNAYRRKGWSNMRKVRSPRYTEPAMTLRDIGMDAIRSMVFGLRGLAGTA